LKILHQGLIEKFQSRCAEKFSIKVRLQKVKHMCTSAQRPFTPEGCTGAPFFNQGAVEKFQSRCAEKFSSRV
jgi:hypothetical protein